MHRRLWTVALLIVPFLYATPAAAAVTPVARINFQPASSTVPSGYTADTGAAFTAARGSGWVVSGSQTPLDLTRNTRDRARSGVDARLNTLIHLQYGDVGGSNGVLTAGAWEYAVPAGTYQVTVSAGDQAPYDSSHTVRVEGAAAITGFGSAAGAEFRQATVTVPVSDGRLTVDAVGGRNTKLNYLTIDRITADPPPFALKVDFSDAASAPASGYVRDSGGAYTAGSGYGWVDLGEGTPVDLTGNGRNRNPAAGQSDPRLATFVHAQLPAGSAGVATPGAWEAAVPSGTYAVTVAVGDAGTAVNSVHWVNVEDQNAIAEFRPTSATKFATATRVVRVTDGRLTLSPAGGTNTKFAYVDIASVADAGGRPAVRLSSPANLATGVAVTTSVVEDLILPNGGVAAASLTAASVRLTRLADGSAVPATTITSGGGDVVNLSPTAPLAANTAYRFTLTEAVTDVTGGRSCRTQSSSPPAATAAPAGRAGSTRPWAWPPARRSPRSSSGRTAVSTPAPWTAGSTASRSTRTARSARPR